jgi:hypothetical protein
VAVLAALVGTGLWSYQTPANRIVAGPAPPRAVVSQRRGDAPVRDDRHRLAVTVRTASESPGRERNDPFP